MAKKKFRVGQVRHLGTAGHFCGSNDCRFHLHTHVGRFCISTIGEYYPPGAKGKMERIGSGYFFETMVFDLKRSEKRFRWLSIDGNIYNSRRASEHGHVEMIEKWSKPRRARR